MQYTEERLDRQTGELVTISKGDWITVTELGALYGVSKIKVRAVLRKMDFLFVPGGQAHQRHRLTPWVVKAGYGKFIPAGRGGSKFPFDVISPEGRAWIDARWTEAIAAIEAEASKPALAEAQQALLAFQARQGRSLLNVQGQVLWLCDHHPKLSHSDVASIIGVSQQIVSRYVSVRSRQRQFLRLRRTAPLGNIVKVQLRHERIDGLMPPVEQGKLPKPTTSSEMNSDRSLVS